MQTSSSFSDVPVLLPNWFCICPDEGVASALLRGQQKQHSPLPRPQTNYESRVAHSQMLPIKNNPYIYNHVGLCIKLADLELKLKVLTTVGSRSTIVVLCWCVRNAAIVDRLILPMGWAGLSSALPAVTADIAFIFHNTKAAFKYQSERGVFFCLCFCLLVEVGCREG